ncbi:MAG: acyl-CoA/acyl-ACP dehydrogenase [Candidatus Brevundimonas phytovorans]|nr:acyl-CoA dehydrogenase family protein [Brevundimonas sp.]WEK56770.1 MAG: acyl-CoA/acyl-ACP dehydrogenase [Brevundimonas sp.]
MQLGEEHRLIGDAAQSLLSETAGLERLRAVVEDPSGWDAPLWSAMAQDMGLIGLMIPDIHGGAGLDAAAMALVLEETGRRLAVVPFFETAVLGVQSLLMAGDDDQQAALLPGVASGDQRMTVAGLAARPHLDNQRLSGVADHVSFAHVADALIVFADDGRILHVPSDAPGLTIIRTPGLDPTRPLSRVVFDVAAADLTVLSQGSQAAQDRIRLLGAGLLAAEQTGAAAFCLEATVAYGRDRIQFGRAIASFQAVKHMLAEMMVRIEASRSAVLYAVTAIDRNLELEDACAVAASWATETLQKCAADQIQLHGGVGFTWEHHAHLYFKRARSSASWLTSPSSHREMIAARLFGDAA